MKAALAARNIDRVAGVLLDSGKRVLLIREKHGALQYGLPGGLVAIIVGAVIA